MHPVIALVLLEDLLFRPLMFVFKIYFIDNVILANFRYF